MGRAEQVNGPIYVSVRWLTAEEGGRKQPPTGPEFRGVAMREINAEGWSIRLKFSESNTHAEATFLVPQAPKWLGTHFWLVEGKPVAEVLVMRGDSTTNKR